MSVRKGTIYHFLQIVVLWLIEKICDKLGMLKVHEVFHLCTLVFFHIEHQAMVDEHAVVIGKGQSQRAFALMITKSGPDLK
jgi:hypothetical protein